MLPWLDSSLYIGLPYALVVLSFVLTFQYLRFPDVTCASTFVLGAATAAGSVVHLGVNPFAALLLAALAGATGGGLTALFHLGLRIDKLLSGILAAFALYSVNLLVLHPSIPYALHPTVLTPWEPWDRALTTGSRVPLHPASIGFLLALCAAAKLALDGLLASELGLCLRALEDEVSGTTALRRIGLAPGLVQSLGLMLGNALVGVAGAVVSMEEGAANVHRGFDVLITGLIAYLIGGKLREWSRALRLWLSPGVPTVPASYTTWALIGPLVYFGVINLAYRVQIPSEYLKILVALGVALAIGDKRGLATLPSRLRGLPVPSVGLRGSGGDSEIVAEITGLRFGYKGDPNGPVIDRVDLRLVRSLLVRIDGPNGSGKSTLLRLLAGRLGSPDRGRIVVDGRDLTGATDRLSGLVGFIDQDPRRELVSNLTVEENLALANLSARPSPLRYALSHRRRALIRDVFAKTRFDDSLLRARCDQISGGQRQVVNILSLYSKAAVPDLVLADEPFNNLDQAHIGLCLSLLCELRELGKCVVLVTHSHQNALCFDQVLRMQDGKLTDKETVGARGVGSEPILPI